ncbi:Nodulin MtN21 /EamA-like transporter-like protein [Zostera marina]|uniref:WAT1-related protein n=1 Tax=Zostera marina TaxID=29655 RepID=A0A0K9P9P9_ZOSMR|nr:Nodulin MtN21 /EamA-like transporter-like protein [Zostera marina]
MSTFVQIMKKAKPYYLMVFLQFGYAGMFIISVSCVKTGTNHYVLVVYRNLVAVLTMFPFAFWFERKIRPKMTFKCFLKIAVLGLLEPVLDQNFYYMGAKLTSATYSSALFNLLPSITFVSALILGTEKINLKSLRSQVKLGGTLITVVGALMMILYKGPIIEFVWSKRSSFDDHRPLHNHEEAMQGTDFIKGTLMLLFCCFCWSSFFILQSHTLKTYPANMSLTTLICLIGGAEGTAVGLVMVRGSEQWAIRWDKKLLTAVYSGVMCSGIAYYLQGVVLRERGPVFVTAFNPLCLIIVAAVGSLFLSEDITRGRVIGAVIIVIGLYMLIWGKSDEHEDDDKNINSEKSEKKNMIPITIIEVEKTINLHSSVQQGENVLHKT